MPTKHWILNPILSADDYTARYWDLLKKAQKDMIPVFDRFKVTMERLTGQQKEEKLLKKMAGIYNILPRLKVEPPQPQHGNGSS